MASLNAQKSLRRPSMYGVVPRSSNDPPPPTFNPQDYALPSPVVGRDRLSTKLPKSSTSTIASSSSKPPLLALPITPDTNAGTRRNTKVGAAHLTKGKRQSVSYQTAEQAGLVQLQKDYHLTAPPLPSLTNRAPSPDASPTNVPLTGPGGIEFEDLNREDFDVNRYIKMSLPPGAGSSVETLRALKSNLQLALDQTATDLQKNVLKNYSEFVTISKEIATLETEMLELKAVIEEWKTVPSSLELATDNTSDLTSSLTVPSNPNAPTNRRAQRNSVADLAALYKSQLEALWENVEGSQRFLPPLPGRHLMTDSNAFVELNAATYKSKQSVHLFLLNDAILVAVRKRSQMGTGKTRLVAERCYGLNEITVVDLKDGGELSNAIKIKRGREGSIFKTERPEDKRALLSAFKRINEESSNRRRNNSIWEAEVRTKDLGHSLGLTAPETPLSNFSPSQWFGFGKDDPTGKDVTWIGDVSDEMAVSIALHEFDHAIALADKAKTALVAIAADPLASTTLRTKLEERTHELVTALVLDLEDPTNAKAGVARAAGHLLRLGEGDRAREVFLAMRGNLMRKRTRSIRFEGDISLYISELAMVCFTLVKNTCEWYMAAFKDNRLASGFVKWASQQIEIFAEVFRRQVYGADQDPEGIEQSLAVTRTHGLMLRDVGLDFSFHMEALLQPIEKTVAGK